MTSRPSGCSIQSSGTLILFCMMGTGLVLAASFLVSARATKNVSFTLYPTKQSLEQVPTIEGQILSYATTFANASPDTIDIEIGIPCSCLEICVAGSGLPISFPLRVGAGDSVDLEVKLSTAGRIGRVAFTIPLSVLSQDRKLLWEEQFEVVAKVEGSLVVVPPSWHLSSANKFGIISLCDSLDVPRYQIAEVKSDSPFLKTTIFQMDDELMFGGKSFHRRGAAQVSLDSLPISEKQLDPIRVEVTAELLSDRAERKVQTIPVMIEPMIVRVVPVDFNLQCDESKTAASKLIVFRSSDSSTIESLPSFCEVLSVSRSANLDVYHFRASIGIGQFIVAVGEHRIVVPIQIDSKETR